MHTFGDWTAVDIDASEPHDEIPHRWDVLWRDKDQNEDTLCKADAIRAAKLAHFASQSYDHAFGPDAVAAAEGDLLGEAWKLLDELAAREETYRYCHDHYGGSDLRTGRAWDWMRQTGDKARAILARVAKEGGGA